MLKVVKRGVKRILKTLGFGILRYNSLAKLMENETSGADLVFLQTIDENLVGRAIHLLGASQSQLRQDIFVLTELGFKRDGYFVEFGATNGFDLSNTYLLEKEFGWSGILAEPAKCWHEDIKKTRKAKISFDCVWKETGQTLDFAEADVPELSTISDFKSKGSQSKLRRKHRTYPVNTISLNDLLQQQGAPHLIDYLSIDTEGSEYEILKDFNFDLYKVSVITCEHNFTDDRQKIYDLLVSKGYKRKFENISEFDDWYVLQ